MLSLGAAEDYLRKAQEAEIEQERASSPLIKESWERIIVSYLELADMAGRRDRFGLADFSGSGQP